MYYNLYIYDIYIHKCKLYIQVAPSPRKPISPDPMGKPPASPASREITAAGDSECVFLIGIPCLVPKRFEAAAYLSEKRIEHIIENKIAVLTFNRTINRRSPS